MDTGALQRDGRTDEAGCRLIIGSEERAGADHRRLRAAMAKIRLGPEEGEERVAPPAGDRRCPECRVAPGVQHLPGCSLGPGVWRG